MDEQLNCTSPPRRNPSCHTMCRWPLRLARKRKGALQRRQQQPSSVQQRLASGSRHSQQRRRSRSSPRRMLPKRRSRRPAAPGWGAGQKQSAKGSSSRCSHRPGRWTRCCLAICPAPTPRQSRHACWLHLQWRLPPLHRPHWLAWAAGMPTLQAAAAVVGRQRGSSMRQCQPPSARARCWTWRLSGTAGQAAAHRRRHLLRRTCRQLLVQQQLRRQGLQQRRPQLAAHSAQPSSSPLRPRRLL